MILGVPTNPIEMQPPKCARCGGQMQEGFIPDAARHGSGVPFWVAGKPDLGVFGHANIGGKEAHRILTFRCAQCGYLESYALGNP